MNYTLAPKQAQECIKRIRESIQDYFHQNNLTYAIFGKSEGLDSSVIAGLLADLDGVRPIGALMPCESKPEVERIAKVVLEHFRIPWIKVDLTYEYHSLMARFYSSDSVDDQLARIFQDYGENQLLPRISQIKARASGNIKVRLRMITLYHIAQLTGGLVISTDNLSEMWMGFWTLNGVVGDFSPIQHVWKGLEEYAIAEALGVPQESIRAVPTDGLDIIPGGTDEDQLGLPYCELDRVIIRLLQNKFDGTDRHIQPQDKDLLKRIAGETELSLEKISHVAMRMINTNYKRNWPWVLNRNEIGLEDINHLNVVE